MIEIRTGLLVVGLCLFFLQRATAQQQHQDCNPVDSTALSVSHDPDGDWVVLERNRAIVGSFTTKQDADRALVLVKHSQAQCFIGRDNPTTDSRKYITEYWLPTDKFSGVAIPGEQCKGYDPSRVIARQQSSREWVIKSGATLLGFAAREEDATKLVNLAKHHNRHCFIGKRVGSSESSGTEYWR
ncbi:MAG: hypothetical protein ABSD89_12975 [Halobacteriota archaeon]|jgi:hypothetical protein